MQGGRLSIHLRDGVQANVVEIERACENCCRPHPTTWYNCGNLLSGAAMSSHLPLFETSKFSEILPQFEPDAELVLFDGDVNTLLATVPDNTLKLIITSPPYNLGKEYERRTDVEKYLEAQTEIIRQLHRVLHETGSLCWQVGNFVEDGEVYPLDILYYPIFKSLGFQLRNRIIWRFGHGLHANRR
jgi:hypothetical protein